MGSRGTTALTSLGSSFAEGIPQDGKAMRETFGRPFGSHPLLIKVDHLFGQQKTLLLAKNRAAIKLELPY